MSNSAGDLSYPQKFRDPNLAAFLSLVPGLGQLYTGQTRKGLLFLAVGFMNLLFFILMLTNQYVVSGLINFGAFFHMRPDADLLSALRELHLGSILSFILTGLFFAFVTYVMRDAYDHALYQQRKHIYPEYVLEMPEATSGSYLLHFATLILFFVLAIFF